MTPSKSTCRQSFNSAVMCVEDSGAKFTIRFFANEKYGVHEVERRFLGVPQVNSFNQY